MATQRYLVTARKYRPQRFDELVAQEHVTETLKNAIRLDRLAHAYLFSGPRGVGKTTAARILAKAINCTTPLEEREGNAEPCRTCDSCRTFEEGRSLNIIEIDAASNNRVDDIRELRETVRIPPQGGRKKVYIVDEVHMLSPAAFNALLKTLEEPPPHVLFIFATTEPHKVLPTILSRCQRFDFRRISVPEIIARLHEICGEEDISADEASLMLIARKGDGALRDALSVFDQAVSLCGNELHYAELAQALGVVDVDLYFDVTAFVAERSAAGMLRLVDRIVRSGYDLQEFLTGLAEHLRNLLVARAMSDTSLIEAAEATRERYAAASTTFSEADLLRLLTLASSAEESIKNSTQPRLKLETALLKMATISLAADLRQAIDKIDRLEKMAREGTISADLGGSSTGGGGPVTGGGGPASADNGAAAVSNTDSSVSSKNAGSSAAPKPPSESAPSSPPSSTPSAAGAPPATPKSEPEAAPAASSEPEAAPAASSEPDEIQTAQFGPSAAGGASRPDRPESAPTTAPHSTNPTSNPPSPAPDIFGKPAIPKKKPPSSTNAATTSANEDVDVAVADAPDASPLAQIWDDFVAQVTGDRIHVGSLLKHSQPDDVRGEVATIGVPDDFHYRLLSHQQNYLLEQIKPLLSVSIRSIRFVVRDDLEAPDAEETASDFDPYEYMQRKRQENPVIRAIFDQFGGELVW